MQEPEKGYTSSNSHNIGDIYISIQLDRAQVILTLENHGHNQEKVYMQRQKTHTSGTETYKVINLSSGEREKIRLPSTLMKYYKFDCRLGSEKWDLKELLNKVITKSQMTNVKPSFSNNESEFAPQITTTVETESEKEINNTRLHVMTAFQQEENYADLDKHEQEIGIEEVIEDDDLIDNAESEVLKTYEEEPEIQNQIAKTIRNWITELERSEFKNHDVIQTLRYSEQEFKRLLDTKTEYNHGNFEEYDQFIKDRLFNGVARFIQSKQIPKHLITCLKLVGYEVVPIEIGKTQADARIHDIQASRQTGSEYGTVVEVLIPGLRRITDGEIIQKPVVIRGE